MLQDFNNCQGLICSTDDVEMKRCNILTIGIIYYYYK